MTTSVNKTKELKKLIQEIPEMINEVYRELYSDLEQPATNVDLNPICRPDQNAVAYACVAEYKRLVCEVIGASNDAGAGAGGLAEHERRIQESLQTLKQIHETHKEEKKRKDYRNTTTTTTTRSESLKQANEIIATLRKDIVAFKIEAETVVGMLIHRAEQCRAFIRECRKQALIEFAASEWWRATHYYWNVATTVSTTDAMTAAMTDDAMEENTSEYKFRVTPLPIPKWHRMTLDDHTAAMTEMSYFIVTMMTTTTMTMNAGTMEEEQREVTEEKELGRFALTREFEDRILTPEAIRGFEWEEAQMWYYAQQQAHDAAQNVDAMEE